MSTVQAQTAEMDRAEENPSQHCLTWQSALTCNHVNQIKLLFLIGMWCEDACYEHEISTG